MRTYI